VGLLDKSKNNPEQSGGTERSTNEVNLTSGCTCSCRHCCSHEDQRHEDERHVEREDPAPRSLVDDHPSGERPDDGRDPAPGRPTADRRTSLVRRERRNDDRQRARDHQRRGCSLQRTGTDEHFDRRGESAGDRYHSECRDADREYTPLTVDVTK
jgi:hypothetical protein